MDLLSKKTIIYMIMFCVSDRNCKNALKRERWKKKPVLQGHLYVKIGSEITYQDYSYQDYCVSSWKIGFIKLLLNFDDLIGNLTL